MSLSLLVGWKNSILNKERTMNFFGLSGRLTRDGHTTPHGDRKVHRFGLAVSNGGETQFFDNLEFWTDTDSKLELRKGCAVEVYGRLKTYTPEGGMACDKRVVFAVDRLEVTHWPKRDADTNPEGGEL